MAYLDSREVAPLLRAVARVDDLLEAGEETLKNRRVVELGLLIGQQAVSIDRPSSEASSISLLEAEEETL